MNKNLALTLTAATLFIVIGIMAAWWFNGGNIDSVKPYVVLTIITQKQS